jgi:predicted ATP-dependent endonuclease of OLD family
MGVECNNIGYSSLSMGAGEQRIFFILKEVFRAPKYALILIDEIDLLLHGDALHKLLEILIVRAEEKHLQIIFTTHDQSIIELEDKINIRHILQTPHKTLCFNETKPDAMQRLTGKQERKLEVFVEDDLAKAIIKKISAEVGISKHVSIKEFGAAKNCFTALSGSLLNEDKNLENMPFVLDGDRYCD